MNTDLILFLLRLASGGVLMGIMASVILILWRDYRTTIEQLAANRRVYGQLVTLQEIDGQFVVTGQTHPLRPITSMGRAPTNNVVIPDTFASGDHAQIILRNGQWWLEDRRSRNGTTLNELPVTSPTVMTDGDVIGIGNRRFRLDLER